ncbi:putative multi antimicrobial extrusion protein [Rosa chinensis]|uniref:Protein DETOXIFICATION n=1 Tax=Rosa chinensis TaxID=74649 RepID=A0A2P6QWG4_ROSCH|nr:putative multi antimicrobial extrusion protein [Rosa chinensis]
MQQKLEMGQMVDEKKKWTITFARELKKEGIIAAPMVAVTALQYLLQLVSMIMVGHLDQLSLSSVAIAISLTNVTGFSLLFVRYLVIEEKKALQISISKPIGLVYVSSGLAGGLETLCGQAFGAEQYQRLGTYTCTAMISLLLVCPPVCLLWIFMDKLLPLVGQDPLISLQARKYSMWLIPALFGASILKPLTRYFQSQSLIFPMLLSSFAILLFHISASWALVYKLEFGSRGSAIAFSLSTWLYVVMLGSYAMYSSVFEKTRIRISKDSILHVGEFFCLAIPSAVMVCLKWWSCELLIFLSGLLPNPKLETSVLSIWYNSISVPEEINLLDIDILKLSFVLCDCTALQSLLCTSLYHMDSDLLQGAGNPQAARVAVQAAVFLSVTEAIIVSTTLFCCRYVLGSAFSSETQVADYVAVMTPLICLSVFMDSLQAVLSGVARGSGWQHLGAYVNLGAFYLVGLPVAMVLGFPVYLRGKGLWIGIVVGSVVQSTLLGCITCFTNWTKQVHNSFFFSTKI